MKTIIVVGSREDPQIKVLAEFADIVFFWEDWNRSWQIGIQDSEITFYRGECPCDDLNSVTNLSAHKTHLYIRFGGCPEEAHDMYLALVSFHPEMIGVARPGYAPENKLSQLRLFGAHAPKTVITNLLTEDSKSSLSRDLGHEPELAIVKNISILRSQTASLKSYLKDKGGETKLSIPTLIQERLTGKELKYHFLQTSGGPFEFNAQIIKQEDLPDYRYESRGFLCQANDDVPNDVRKIAQLITSHDSVPLIDMDYFLLDNGQIKILEWNDSPESVSFESRAALRQNWCFSRMLLAPSQIVTIAPENDRVVEIVAENYFEFCPDGADLVALRCESFTAQWNFGVVNGSLFFYFNGKPLIPKGIYIRPVNVPQHHFESYDSLFRAIEMWQGEAFGRMDCGYFNMSKMFQATSSLQRARIRSQSQETITFPKSYFIKGSLEPLKRLMAEGKGMIVKSCSGQRSIVVDDKAFAQWEVTSLAGVPTLFQDAVYGPDIRVHSLKAQSGTQAFAMRVSSKDSIDYRYAEDRSGFETFTMSDEVLRFVNAVHEEEENPLVGVDFIEHSNQFYCLEANPTPGWNWYYNKSTCKTNFLALGILKKMGLKDTKAVGEGRHASEV